MSSWREKARQFLLRQEEEDDELFFILVPAVLLAMEEEETHVQEVIRAIEDFLGRENFLRDTRRVEVEKQLEEYSVEKCLDTTNAMEELTDEDKAIASKVFENDMNRQIFMKQKDHEVRLIWLQRKIRRLAAIYEAERSQGASDLAPEED